MVMMTILGQVTEPILALIEKAERQGHLTIDDMITQFPRPEERIDEIERAFVCLDKAGFEVRDSRDGSEERHDRSEGNGIEPEHGLFDLSEIPCDDSVGLYLKEMGCVPLLSLEQEVRLAKAVCQGREAEQALQKAGLDPDGPRCRWKSGGASSPGAGAPDPGQYTSGDQHRQKVCRARGLFSGSDPGRKPGSDQDRGKV